MIATIFPLAIILFITDSISAVSYNQPNLSLCASWNENATTFADINWVGQQPVGIFINDKNVIYVANREHGRILVWQNGSLTSRKMNISGNLTNPWSLFVTTEGDVYVDRWAINATDSKIVMKVNSMCTGLFVDTNDNLYCSSTNNHRVVKIALKSGQNLPSTVAGTGCPGPVSNMLDHPHGIFVDKNLNLYVADTHNDRIQLFALGQMNAITMAGFGAAVYFQLNRPTGVVLDANGYLFIVDSHNHRIIRSIPNEFKCVVGCSGNKGSSLSQLDTPQTMAFDKYGNIFVSDFNNHRVQKFTLTWNSCVISTTASPYTPSTDLCGTAAAISCAVTTTVPTSCQSYEVSWNGNCYYLDGSGGNCTVGYRRATNAVLDCIATRFAGKTYRSTISNNCCIWTADTYECYGMNSNCNSAGPFTSGPIVNGGGGCKNSVNHETSQLTFCGSI